MSYFRADGPSEKLLRIAESSLATAAEAAAKFERGGRMKASDYGIDLAKLERHRDDARREHEAFERERRAELSKIRKQAVKDARAAWNAGDAFFAPVLFQQLARDGAGWEVALQEVSAIGWRLDSWQVIGPAPSSFEGTVTLIQTLFVR